MRKFESVGFRRFFNYTCLVFLPGSPNPPDINLEPAICSIKNPGAKTVPTESI